MRTARLQCHRHDTACRLYTYADECFEAQHSAFDEIDGSIVSNVREGDGTLRMTISNSGKAPGMIVRGKERPHPQGRKDAGNTVLQ